MSIAAVAWAARQTISPPARKYILQTLADRANSDGECWPSIASICEVVGLKERMVRRHIQALISDGYMCTENRGRSTNIFRLNLTGTPVPDKEGLTGTQVPDNAGTPVPVNEIDNRYSSTSDLQPLTGTPVHLNRYSSTSRNLIRNHQEPSEPDLAHAQSRAREGPAWLKDLYRLGWADGNRLDERETERIVRDYGALDLCSEVEKFVDYWQSKSKPSGNWSTYRRLRTWLDRAKNGWNGDRRRDNRTGFGRIIPPKPGELSITRRHTG